MKNKILLVLLVIVSFFAITGCGSEKEEKKEEKEVDEKSFTINRLEFQLDKDNEFKDIKFTTSKDFLEVNQPIYIQYNYYQEDNSNLLFFRIFYYEKRDLSFAIRDLGFEEDIKLTDGKTNNIEYKFYSDPRDDGGTIHFYFIKHNDDYYVLHFTSKYDIKDFEEKTLKTIKF